MDKDFLVGMFSLYGKTAIVTGGMGNIGSNYVETLVKAGAKVAILDITNKVHPLIVKLFASGYHNQVRAYCVDITKEEDVKGVLDEIRRDLGTPTILVNNAGLASVPNETANDNCPFEDYPVESFKKMLDSHLTGAFILTKGLVKGLKEKGLPGSIINISSTYGLVAPDQSMYDCFRKDGKIYFKPFSYGVAKSGMLQFTAQWAEYCGRYCNPPVRVNTLAPGGVELASHDKEFVREYSKRTMLGRMATNADYNGALLFLASDASAYMTGATVVVDGGWTAH